MLTRAQDALMKDGVVLEQAVVTRWNEECMKVLSWLADEIQASFQIGDEYKRTKGGLMDLNKTAPSTYLEYHRSTSMRHIIDILVFVSKLDRQNSSSVHLRRLLYDLVHSYPGGLYECATLLHEAARSKPTSCFYNRQATLTLLLECGANPADTDEKGNSALHVLADEFVELMEQLSHAGTADTLTEAYSLVDITSSAELLLQHGAHADARNANGKIALDAFRDFMPAKFDVFSFLKLQCLAARTLRNVDYPLALIPSHLVDFVLQH
jgi:hypothetical protein